MTRIRKSSKLLRAATFAVAVLGSVTLAQAQSNILKGAVEVDYFGPVILAQAQPKAPEGMPWFFQALPQGALQSAWDTHRAVNAPNTAVPPKYKSLIGLAVSAQIPCDYCIIANTENARKAGATEEEIREAIAVGAMTRFWSTVLQGNQTDQAKFKAAFGLPTN